MKPREAVLAITYRCNARCEMCNIWKSPETIELEPEQFKKLPSTLKTVNITGGEPFLRRDIVQIVRALDSICPSARIVFSTNGLMTDTIVSAVSEVMEFHRRVGVGVSVDGLGETHDKIRGVKGAYQKAISTVEGLKSAGVDDLRIGMTLVRENLNDAKQVFDLSKKLGVEFTTTFAHNSEIYFQKTDNPSFEEAGISEKSLDEVLKAQLRSSSAKDWFRAYHVQGIMDPRLRQEFVSRCKAGDRYFFMAPNGDIFPCMVMAKRIGNLRDVKVWDELFKGDVDASVRESVRGCTEDCWMVCNTRSLIISHPFKAGYWVLRNKIGSHIHE